MKFFLIVLLSIISVTTFSQEIDLRLLNRYSQDELIEMKNNNINEYEFLIYALDHSIYTTIMSDEKYNGLDIKSIDITNKDLNFIALDIQILDNTNQYYKIVGDNKLLVVKSRYVLNQEIKQKK